MFLLFYVFFHSFNLLVLDQVHLVLQSIDAVQYYVVCIIVY